MSLKSSILSSVSMGVGSRRHEEISFDDINTEDLQQMLEDAVQKNWLLSLENDVFERYLTRQDPHCLKTIGQILERAKHARRVTAQIAQISSRVSLAGSTLSLPDRGSPSVASIRSGSRYATPSLLTTGTYHGCLKIGLPQRIEMAKREIEIARNNLDELEQAALKEKAMLIAKMEGLELQIRETHEALAEFEEEVVTKGIDPLTGKIPAEKVVRFIEDWMKTADTIVERLRLKGTTIKSQIKKAKQQLIQREELGEALRAVDFEQLNIECKDYIAQIEEKNQHLLDVKKITGRYSLQLTRQKQKLSDLLHALATVRKEIYMKQQQIEKLQSEQATIKTDVENTEGDLESLLDLMETYNVPDILDFVKLKIEVQKLTKIYKRLSRQKKLYEITSKPFKKRSLQNKSNRKELTDTYEISLK